MDVSIETNYEVIRFIEHGSRCRPAMDYVPGELLIYRLKRCPEVEKEVLFEWMKQLLCQLELYHRWRGSQCYRYVNPFSVLVTREDKILLLDLEADSNGFVLRNMQKRAMRNHFVKPIIHIRENAKISLDLYGFGKTIQFILANTEVEPSLTKREEYRLEKIIEKCLGENPKKQYENLNQVQRELPTVPTCEQKQRKKRIGLILLTGGILLLFSVSAIKIQEAHKEEKRSQVRQELQKMEEDELQSLDQDQVESGSESTDQREEETELQAEETGPSDRLDGLSEEIDQLQAYLLHNTTKDNSAVIEQGEALQKELIRYLAAAYDREEMTEKALAAYEMLCETEDQEELLKTAYIRRIELEMQLQEMGRAAQVGREAVERFPELKESEAYQKLEEESGSLEEGDMGEEQSED